MKLKLKGNMTVDMIEDWLLTLPRDTVIEVKAEFKWKRAEKDADM